MHLNNQRVAILGGGRSGIAAAALAVREGALVTLFDSAGGAAAAKLEAWAANFPSVELITGTDALESKTRRFDLVVTSPGISLVDGWGANMAACGARAIGEIEFASWYFSGKSIGITGTNGKTTTTEMIRELLCAAGEVCVAAGNYGLPLSEVVLNHPEVTTVALELSSFQLETISDFAPTVALWLNFAPDHMDRYPDLAAYRAAKERIYLNLGVGHQAVVPPCERATAARSGAKICTFDVDDTSADWHIKDGKIIHSGEVLMDLANVAVRGRHNHANMLAAMAAVDAFGASLAHVETVFSRYLPPPHRYEWIATIQGVDFINDSKSTNLHSLETALLAERRPRVLIAGGKEKGLDFSPLAELVNRHCRAVVAIGEIRHALRAAWGPSVVIPLENDFAAAIHKAHALAEPGDAVLLSPGTSSFDMFRDYTHRGEEFRRIVLAMTHPTFSQSTSNEKIYENQ